MIDQNVKTGLKNSKTIYKDRKEESITKEDTLPATLDKDYDEIKIVKKEYHDTVHCDDCHNEVEIVYAIHKTTFVVQKCSKCIMDWLELKNPEFKSELTTELL